MDVDSSCVSPSTSSNEVLEYSHMIVPPTMRSQYWQYFGFPCDNYNNIVTKKKVICTLCHTLITYNKNTTNLRTHLVAKHPNHLYELNASKKLKTDEKTPDSSDNIKLKTSTIRMPDKEFERFISAEEQSKINEQTAIIEALVENDIIQNDDTDKKCERNELQEYSTTLDPQSYQVIEIGEAPPSQDSLTESIVEWFTTDLLPVSAVEGVGLATFVDALLPNTVLPSKEQVERHVKTTYFTTFNDHLGIIQNHTARHPFSIGMEFWENMGHKTFINIYVNFITLEKDQLKNILYKTVSTKESTNSEILKGINLKNCTAAIVNRKSNIIDDLLNGHGIPIIMCFGTLIRNCLKQAFNLKDVKSLIDNVLKYLSSNENQVEIDVPDLYEEFPSTKLTLLSNFYEKLTTSYTSWSVEAIELMEKSKEVIDCLSPLKVTLETLADEPIALYSLLKPLATKLLNEYLQVYNGDSNFVECIKEIISNELSGCISDKPFPSLATFFDPRFLNFIDAETFQIVKDVLNEKIKTEENVATEVKKENTEERKRKSTLKLFFENDDLKRNPKVIKTNSEAEIQKYANELCDMEQCPLTWWNEYGYVYRNLKTIAQNYLCVPATVNSMFKKSINTQIEYVESLKMLKSDADLCLLYLHINK